MVTNLVQLLPLNSVRTDAGWQAALSLNFAVHLNKTVITDRYQYGPLTVQRPFYPEGSCCHVYLLHPPGGIVGGDSLKINLQLAENSHVLITMPGATKFYRTISNKAILHYILTVNSGAILEWLPPTNIIFDAARAYLCGNYQLAKGAKLFGWESLQLGRSLADAPFIQGMVDNLLIIQIPQHDGLFERLRLTGDRLAILKHFCISATCFAYPASVDMLCVARQVLAHFSIPSGATLLDDMLVVRLLSNDNQQTQSILYQLWSVIRPLLIGLKPCPPRIWHT